ncbi:MAG TPA: M36 family metallopeptidase [Thermoanaerobaculia bacterium]|nr:M36 family metallopeptidase [Thermoanaerobaculia bacterium]
MRSDRLVSVLRRFWVLAVAVLPALTALPVSAAVTPRPEGKVPAAGNLDVRVTGGRDLLEVLAGYRLDPRRIGSRVAAQIKTLRQGVARLKAAFPGAEVSFSPLFGAAEVVRNPRGTLTGPAPGRPGLDIVQDFLHANAGLYGLSDSDLAALRCTGESVNRRSGLRMVRCEQTVHGLPVFQSDTRVILDRSGQIVRAVGLLAPHAQANALAVSPQVTAQQALAAAMKSVAIDLDPAAMNLENASPDGTKGEVTAGDPRILGRVPSHLVYFPLAPGVLVPAWQQVTFTKGPGDWTTVVDAGTGILLWRKNIRSYASTQEARFSVYVQADGKTPAENPAPHSPTDLMPLSGTQFPEIPRTTVSMMAAQDIFTSPNGWIDDNGNTTTGNNVDAYLDTDGNDIPDASGRPIGNLDITGRPRDFLGTGFAYTPAPLGGNPDAGDAPSGVQFQHGAVTQLFYLANWYHDQLYTYGFDEAAGNFQQTNFSGMGLGGDRVLAEVQDGPGTNNASFSTPPDGTSGRMQMSVFDFPAPDRDSSLDATIVFHELTHGLTNRLIGNGTGLSTLEARSMGEGWSDFYALSLLFGSNAYNPDKEYAVGAYSAYKIPIPPLLTPFTDNYLYGIRRFPYSTNHNFSPITWLNHTDPLFLFGGSLIPVSPLNPLLSAGGPFEEHNLGEIWANTLWEIRSCIIASVGHDVPTGNAIMLSLVTDALKLTPVNPTYIDAQNALLDANCATNGCANNACIWQGFANRGMGSCQGYCANASLGPLGAGAFFSFPVSFSLPYLDIESLTVDDPQGNHNGVIDPGEEIRLTVELENPWRPADKGVASATATLTSSTPGVAILTGSSTYPAIAAQATASGTPFRFSVPADIPCGQALHFTLTTTSTLGTKSLDFTLRVGKRAGTEAPVTYTRSIPGGLAIPDDDFYGVSDTMTITDDREIADLNFRVDDLTHSSTGDLVVGLQAPSGYGTSLIYRRGIFVGDTDGDNFVNTVIDGDASNDLNQTDATGAPYTGDWLPAFNSPIWGLLGIPNLGPDPIDQFSFMEGGSTQGAWKVYVFDEAPLNVGRLNRWSLIVTPTAFTCAAFNRVTATKTAAGAFVEGGTVTYTIVLTNHGTGTQPDAPGNELTDVLPAGMTLVDATATSGTPIATIATNTVTWNGSIPASGSVTITTTATIAAGTLGSTLINQATVAFDANGDGSNEATSLTDNPATPAAGDGTAITIERSIAEVPTLTPQGFAVLGLLLAGAGIALLRRQRANR